MQMFDDDIPKEDQEVWQEFLENPGKEREDEEEEVERLIVDLHGKTIEESYKEISQIIEIARNKKIKILQIITGIGIHYNNKKGILYEEVPRLLEDFKQKKKIRNYKRNVSNDGEIIVKL